MSTFLTPRQIAIYRKLYCKVVNNRGRDYKSYMTEEEYAIAHALYIENEPAASKNVDKQTVELIIINSLRNILNKNGNFI